MVGEQHVGTVLSVVLAVGAPLLVALFYAEGLVLGKFAQPSAVFVAYVSLTTPGVPFLVVLCVTCVGAASLGQWTLYRGFNDDSPRFFGLRELVPYLDRIPGATENYVGQRRLEMVETVVHAYGTTGIVLLNLIPGIRGLSAIPAGLSRFPRDRFLLASTAGNAVFTGLLVAVALGIVELWGLLG